MSGWSIWFKRKFRGIESQAMRDCKEADAAYACQDYETALALYEEGLKRFREIERWDMVLFLRLQMGDVARLSGDHSTARIHLEQAVSLARNQKHTYHLEAALIRLASVATYQGEIALAERLCAECLQKEHPPEKAIEYAAIQSLLGAISRTIPAGLVHYKCALAIYREQEHQEGIQSCLCDLGHCTGPGQDNSQQRVCLQECLELCETREDERIRSYVLNNLGNIERFEGRLDRAIALYRDSLNIKQRIGDEWAIAYTIEGCAGIAVTQGQGAKAAGLLGKAAEIRRRLGAPLEPRKQPEYEAILAQVREMLTAADFELAWEEGARLSLTQTVAKATSEPI